VSLAGFIAAQRAEHGIPYATSCRAVGVSQAWFYKWVNGDVSLRRTRREALAAQIRYLFTKHKRRYGSPRITADLQTLGWRVSKNTVAVLMRELGLVARPKRRRGTTKADRSARKAPDLVGRDFSLRDKPNQVWVGDLTDIPNQEGSLYLASVLDLHSRRVVGFAMDAHHDAELARGALCTAIAIRGGEVTGVVFHTDRGGEGGFKGSSQHLDQEVLEWDVGQAGSQRRREGRRCGRLGEHRWRIVSIGCGFGNRSLVGRPVRMLGSEPACHRRLERDGSVRLAGCLHRVSSRTAAAI
jgi:hypothetical protein